MSGCGCEFEAKNSEQQKILRLLLLINAVMFVVEIGAGVLAQSTALIADSLDMLADAVVYGIGLYAVGRSVAAKIHAANLSGWFQMAIGLGVIVDVVRRYMVGSEPVTLLMFSIGVIALLANIWCVKLLYEHRDGEVHMRASWIFTKNDVLANLGILLAAGLVFMFDSSLPDLIAGFVIAALVIRGGVVILKEGKQEKAALSATSCSANKCEE